MDCSGWTTFKYLGRLKGRTGPDLVKHWTRLPWTGLSQGVRGAPVLVHSLVGNCGSRRVVTVYLYRVLDESSIVMHYSTHGL